MMQQSARSLDPPTLPSQSECPIRAANAVNGRQSNPVHSTWRVAKKRGDRAERIAAGLIRLAWRDVISTRRIESTLEAQRTGDLLVTHRGGQQWTCEVKADFIASESGLLAVETARRVGQADVPTGLSQSWATRWAFLLPDSLILAVPEELRHLLAEKRAEGTLRELRVGDDRRTLVALVPIDEVTHLPGTVVLTRDQGR